MGLVAGTGTPHPAFNVAHYALGTGHDNSDGTSYGSQAASVPGGDGTGLPGTSELTGDPATFTGIYALDKVDLFNLLSIIDAVQPSGRA